MDGTGLCKRAEIGVTAAMVTLPPAPRPYAPPTDPALTVLHVDEEILVVDKPSGLLRVPGKAATHADCLAARAADAYDGARIVHRLDMDTSGVMVLARTRASHRHLGLQFERRHVSKYYIADVHGFLATGSGTIDLPLLCDWPNRPRQKVDPERGRKAVTDWWVISRTPGVTRVALRPLTGRSHQLRVHLLAIGHPILGDPLYAKPDPMTGVKRLHLHATELTLRHPIGGRPMTFATPVPF